MRGTHLTGPETPGRVTITLDAGLAFGTGEHGSTRGCLLALERVARRRPRHIIDVGTGSGILAMVIARLLRRRVLGTDIEPWAVRTARQNVHLNGLSHLVRVMLANGWTSPAVRAGGPYDLVLENILARPVCAMARTMARRLAPGGTAILSGLLHSQARMVLAAHRAQGLRLEAMIRQGNWTTVIVRKAPAEPAPKTKRAGLLKRARPRSYLRSWIINPKARAPASGPLHMPEKRLGRYLLG